MIKPILFIATGSLVAFHVGVLLIDIAFIGVLTLLGITSYKYYRAK